MRLSKAQKKIIRAGMSPGLLGKAIYGDRWIFARHLQLIDRHLYHARKLGRRYICLSMPPRHGKSMLTSELLPASWACNCPNDEILVASYSSELAREFGKKSRGIVEDYGHWFGIHVDGRSSASDNWGIAGHRGVIRCVGVKGSATGKGARLLIVDDPHKDLEEATSDIRKQRVWEWFQSVATTRLEPDATVIVIQTRWAEDDLIGRILSPDFDGDPDEWIYLRFPAIAEDTDDLLGRNPGEALFPERFPLEALDRVKRNIGPYLWAALYQQRPAPLEGGLFKRDWFKLVDRCPIDAKILDSVRYWDLAASVGPDADHTAGVRIDRTAEGYFIRDVVRGRWEPTERDRIIFQTARMDGQKTIQHVEQEGGSAGKDVAQYLARQIGYQGNIATHSTVQGDKTLRSHAAASAAGTGLFTMLRAPWNLDFISELVVFPNGSHDDQVDGLSGAFNRLALRSIGSGDTATRLVVPTPDPVKPKRGRSGHPYHKKREEE